MPTPYEDSFILPNGQRIFGKLDMATLSIGRTVVVSATPVVSTTAYAIDDCVGSLLTFAAVARKAGGSGLIQMVEVFCKTSQAASLDLILFNATPSASTFTDNAAVAVDPADFDKIVGVVHLTDWTDLGVPSVAQADNLAKPFLPAGSSMDIYGVLVTRTVMTLGSTSDIKVAVKALQD